MSIIIILIKHIAGRCALDKQNGGVPQYLSFIDLIRLLSPYSNMPGVI